MPGLLWINQFALLPGDGGGTRHFELGRELVRKGWDVTLLASDLHLHRREYTQRENASDRRTLFMEQEGVKIGWAWAAEYSRNDWRRAWNWISFYRSVVRARRQLSSKPDVIIGSSPQLFAAAAALRLARKLDAPFIFEVRDLWPESLLAAGGKRGFAYRILERIAARLYREADSIVVLARGTGDYLVDRGVRREKISYIPNGVDVNMMKRSIVTTQDVAVDRPFTLVYAGAHGPANGLDKVLDAAAILGPEAGARFLLVGDGPIKKELRENAEARGLSHVEFRDPVSKFELADLLNRADAGLMVLREAPLFSFAVSPNKLFDYLAAELPVVCNVPGEVAGMLRDANAGIQADAADGEALARAIGRMIALPRQQRAAMGRAGRQWVVREHSREVLGDRLLAHLREHVAR